MSLSRWCICLPLWVEWGNSVSRVVVRVRFQTGENNFCSQLLFIGKLWGSIQSPLQRLQKGKTARVCSWSRTSVADIRAPCTLTFIRINSLRCAVPGALPTRITTVVVMKITAVRWQSLPRIVLHLFPSSLSSFLASSSFLRLSLRSIFFICDIYLPFRPTFSFCFVILPISSLLCSNPEPLQWWGAPPVYAVLLTCAVTSAHSMLTCW
jgi:hypothetical protein